ncbi:hypothetical protein GCM10010435_16910 [Winogradskya consettensis]|uniref:Flavin reductase n=1 Tax=Winogradskya consettensis TaxID=113560 RepID=A0A919SUJ4_9ACTN|nr:hypothetical protein Aco04nite_62140 [Actinoplanes consettensis]
MQSGHEPVRPKWNCRECGLEWPCEYARRELTADFVRFPTSFAIYMAHCYSQALHDSPSLEALPPDLWTRFMGWLPRS